MISCTLDMEVHKKILKSNEEKVPKRKKLAIAPIARQKPSENHLKHEKHGQSLAEVFQSSKTSYDLKNIQMVKKQL